MNNKFWEFFGDNFVSLATIVGGAIVLILSIVGGINESVLLQAILGLLVLLATSGIVERHKRLDAIYEQTSQIVKLDNDVRVFDDVDEYYHFLASRVARSKKCIDVINFRPSLPRNVPSRQIYQKTIEDKMDKGLVRVRRVVINYDLATVEWIRDLLKKYNGKDFWVAYYEKPPEYIPALNMMLIDKQEVFVGGFYQAGQYDESGSIWLNDKKIAKAFQDYYNYLWSSATSLNPKESIQENLIQEIIKRCNIEK